jgi:hypothetical protein
MGWHAVFGAVSDRSHQKIDTFHAPERALDL